MTGDRKKYPFVAIALLALAAVALWVSSRLTWVTVSSADGLTEPRTDELSGSTWFGALTPLALALLASIAAVLATGGWPRRLVGVLVALVAAVTAVPALALLTGSGATAERAGSLAELPGRAVIEQADTAKGPAVLTVFGAVVALLAGVLLTRMPERTARLSGKYDNPVFRKAAATDLVAERGAEAQSDEHAEPLSERVLWDALDAGTDPTEHEIVPDDTGRPRESVREDTECGLVDDTECGLVDDTERGLVDDTECGLVDDMEGELDHQDTDRSAPAQKVERDDTGTAVDDSSR